MPVAESTVLRPNDQSSDVKCATTDRRTGRNLETVLMSRCVLIIVAAHLIFRLFGES